MKKFSILIAFFVLVGCESKTGDNVMEYNKLSNNWSVGPIVDSGLIYGIPPEAEDPDEIVLFGMHEKDKGHRLYKIPSTTPMAEVVRFLKLDLMVLTVMGTTHKRQLN